MRIPVRSAGRSWRWLVPPAPTIRSAALVVVIALVQIVGTLGGQRHTDVSRHLDAWGVALLLLGPALLLWRRRAPGAVLVGVFAVMAAFRLLGYFSGPAYLALVVAFATAVCAGHRALGLAVLAAGYGVQVWLAPVVLGEPRAGAWAASGVAAWLAVLAAATEVARAQLARRSEARRAAAEQQRRESSEERLMIARELHDVLAHAISVINVQAGVGLHLMDRQPQQAREALTTIRRASGDALAELRGLLDTLRDGPDAAGGRAQPPTVGLAQLESLLAASRAAGVQVALKVDGEPQPLAPAADLAAYRIIQESLTNVGKHAQPPRALVEVNYRPEMLRITVRDEGREPTASGSGGRGLAGMRERAGALGGTFAAGPNPAGGFMVRAELPTERGR